MFITLCRVRYPCPGLFALEYARFSDHSIDVLPSHFGHDAENDFVWTDGRGG